MHISDPHAVAEELALSQCQQKVFYTAAGKTPVALIYCLLVHKTLANHTSGCMAGAM